MTRKAKNILTVLGFIVVLIIAGAFLFYFGGFFAEIPNTVSGSPLLTIETPQKLNLSQAEFFTVDVTVSELGDSVYPAASFCISFDPSRLEFMGIKEGNVLIGGYEDGSVQTLPEWNCNTKKSNETGKINLMYLDLTSGKHAFRREFLAKDDNVVFRLSFRLRGSARVGDIYDLTVEDAVFAASDEKLSLATSTSTLKVKNGRIVVGE